jgi:hypothetical protein
MRIKAQQDAESLSEQSEKSAMARERVRWPRSPGRLPWRLNASPLRVSILLSREPRARSVLHGTSARVSQLLSYSQLTARARNVSARSYAKHDEIGGAAKVARRARRGTRMRPTRPVRALAGWSMHALNVSPPLRRRPRPRRAPRPTHALPRPVPTACHTLVCSPRGSTSSSSELARPTRAASASADCMLRGAPKEAKVRARPALRVRERMLAGERRQERGFARV